MAPHGALRLLRRLGLEDVRTVAPGDVLDVAGATIEVLPATHDDRRSPLSQLRGPALGFRVEAGDHSFWFPGDTGLRDDMADVRRSTWRSSRSAAGVRRWGRSTWTPTKVPSP